MSNCDKELYLLANNGKVQMWKAHINESLTEEGYVEIIATYGFVDGKKQHKSTYIKSGKNIGKRNETSIHEQALLKVEQMYADKIKTKAMVWDIKDWVKPKRPSLATAYRKRVKFLNHIKYWLADAKLNGNRAYRFFNGEYQSKSGDVITPLKHVEAEFQKIVTQLDFEIDFDGEFYLHGLDLQQITGIINTELDSDRDDKTTVKLEFHVFDCYLPAQPDAIAKDRNDTLIALFDKLDFVPEYIKLNKKEIVVNDEETVHALTTKFEKMGYEGTILRNPDAPYRHSKNISDRNDDMLKDKNFLDEEFLILDIIENENEVGTAKFIIHLANNLQNEVVMKGKKEDTYKYLLNKEEYIGKYIKVQYQAYTKYGKLEFPVGLEIREGVITEHGFDPKF